jgi:hypothetical protein
MEELSYHSEQIKEFISLALHIRNKQGQPRKNESVVINTIVTAVSANNATAWEWMVTLWLSARPYKERNVK